MDSRHPRNPFSLPLSIPRVRGTRLVHGFRPAGLRLRNEVSENTLSPSSRRVVDAISAWCSLPLIRKKWHGQGCRRRNFSTLWTRSPLHRLLQDPRQVADRNPYRALSAASRWRGRSRTSGAGQLLASAWLIFTARLAGASAPWLPTSCTWTVVAQMAL